MSNIFYLICVFLFVESINSAILNNCTVDHYWKPLTGNKVPNDAFIAGLGKNGKPVYVVQIQPIGSLWITPYEYYEGEVIRFAWFGYSYIEEFRQFVKILCVHDTNSVEWVTVRYYPDEIKDCCLVEGGQGAFSYSFVYTMRVAKAVVKGVTHVGRVYDYRGWDGAHIGISHDGYKVRENYQVLAYGCLNKFRRRSSILGEYEIQKY